MKQTATVCPIVEKKSRKSGKKSATSVTNAFYRQFGGSL